MNDKYCILQDDLKDCGICSLLSIVRYYNGNISKEYLKEHTRTTNNGVNALNLLKCAREIGFEAYGIKSELSKINHQVLPIIAHVIIDKKYLHFIVIYKIDLKKKRLLVMDPAKGYVHYKIDDFMNISTGYFLILKPKHSIPNLNTDYKYINKIYEIVIKNKKTFFIIIILSLFYTLINVISSYHFKMLYEASNSLNIVLLILGISLLIKITFQFLRTRLLLLFNIILDKSLVKDAFYHIINLPYLYYRNHTNGDLLTRINDLGNIKNLLSNFLVSVFMDLLLAIVILFFMFYTNGKLSLLISVFLIIYVTISLLNRKNIQRNIQDTCQKSSSVNSNIVESLSSFETIKNLSIQNYIYHNFVNKYGDFCLANKCLFKKVQNEFLFKNLILELGNLLVIFYGIKMIGNNTLSIVSLITFLSLSNYLIEPIRKLMDLSVEYQNAKESIRRIKELYNISKEKLTISNRTMKYLSGDIDISGVTYSYNGINSVLCDVSFSIDDGDKVLIYGNSGCGKSTLMQLLIKYLDGNYQGNITVGGYDLKDIDLYSLRQNICYISQNEYLYTNSVYENITLGRRVKYSNFLNVCKNVSIDKIVKNSALGYNFVIENNGDNLSGGEAQRIIIARSIFQNANIYIYDETFSEMDIILERKILKFLFETYPNKTFIIISHRFSNDDLFNNKIKIGGENEFIK